MQVEDLGDTERGQSGLGSTGLTEIPAKAVSCVGEVEAVPRRPEGTYHSSPVASQVEQQGTTRPEDTSRNGGGILQEGNGAVSDFPDASSCEVTGERGCCFVASSKEAAEGMVNAVGHFKVTSGVYEYCPPDGVQKTVCPTGLEEMKAALASLSTCSQRELVAKRMYIDLVPVLGKQTGRAVYLLVQTSQEKLLRLRCSRAVLRQEATRLLEQGSRGRVGAVPLREPKERSERASACCKDPEHADHSVEEGDR